ncbi:DNA-binding response regulator [Trinickia symbiotica]|uniref:Phosphate regulon transcriptional regulatory protein PhoB n=1 Tax=Trinickia symbiotica TaxID=863227 RepID=A0A2T3XNB1_9BURK|nr:response regulator transcription factor [Trinickia symbiotica]PTB17947.1 DNA-binding response regulator [Trinickia symbiotica]
MSRNVLVIEDDNDIAQLVRMQLAGLACETTVVNDGRAGLAESLARPYDLVVLDLMLPGIDGLEICKRLRAERRYTPILMLTARSTELDRVLGLELGADDYLAKPFSVLEFVARVKAIFRLVDMLASPDSSEHALIESKDLKIDVEKRVVTVRGASVELTAKEFQLLVHFARNPGRVYTRGQLLDQVWGYSHSGYEHTVNSHINRLRAKIEIDPNSPEYIQTVWGVGYKFCNASGS